MKTVIVNEGVVVSLGGGRFSSIRGGEYAVQDRFADKLSILDGVTVKDEEKVPAAPAADDGPNNCSVIPREGAAGWFDVIDATGQMINENAMRREAADALVAEHNFEG